MTVHADYRPVITPSAGNTQGFADMWDQSTPLKIVAPITAPTNGKEELFKCVASLAEVGTAFHPELAGRATTSTARPLACASARSLGFSIRWLPPPAWRNSSTAVAQLSRAAVAITNGKAWMPGGVHEVIRKYLVEGSASTPGAIQDQLALLRPDAALRVLDIRVVSRSLRRHHELRAHRRGAKPAGGLRSDR